MRVVKSKGGQALRPGDKASLEMIGTILPQVPKFSENKEGHVKFETVVVGQERYIPEMKHKDNLFTAYKRGGNKGVRMYIALVFRNEEKAMLKQYRCYENLIAQ